MEARTQGYGTIGWAISAARNGHPVRRPVWVPGVMLGYVAQDHTLVVTTEPDVSIGTPWRPSNADLLASDWQYVNPTLPGEHHA